MKMNRTTKWAIGGIGVAGIAIGIYLFVKKGNKNNQFKLEESSSNGNGKPVIITSGGIGKPIIEPNWGGSFDMNYIKDVKKWLRGKMIKELPVNVAKKYALQLKKAKGVFDDDEKAVELVFKRLQDKTQVASISSAFYDDYKMDMYEYLKTFLSSTELKKFVKDPVRKLPNYRTI